MPDWQSLLLLQVPQLATLPTVVQVQRWLFGSQTNPEQSASDRQPAMHLLVPPVSQLPLAHCAPLAHAAQRRVLPVGAVQAQVPLPRLHVPPGQSELVTHPLVQVPAAVSQLPDWHCELVVHPLQVGPRGAVQPQVPPLPLPKLQEKPPQSVLVSQPWVQRWVWVLQLPVAH